MAKPASKWRKNPNSEANRYKYDDATIAYNDSNRTYDGNVTNEPAASNKKPSKWKKRAE